MHFSCVSLPRMTHQSLAYADDVNALGGSIHTVRENAEALVVASKEIGVEVNADKTKYMVMSREQTAGLSHTMNSSIERVEEFKYLGTTLTNQNSIQEEIKSRLKLGNACYRSVVFQFAIQKFKDQDILNYNFACCFVWM